MENNNITKILYVDDEANILSGIKRRLTKNYHIKTASSGREGLKIISEEGPFALVISDLYMPMMDGIEFFKEVKKLTSDTVRILLTGKADLTSAISSVNEGHIFRFLTKPCSMQTLLATIEVAEEQYRLITSEHILLEQTLQGCVKTLIEVLSLADPFVFSKTSRLVNYCNELIAALKIKEKWPIKVATMLSQLGLITLPDDTMRKIRKCESISGDEALSLSQLPNVTERLLRHIPRLETVREIIQYQNEKYCSPDHENNKKVGEEIPIGARILKIIHDFDDLERMNSQPDKNFDIMFSRKGWYDETILGEFYRIVDHHTKDIQIRTISVKELRPRMVLLDDIITKGDQLLVAKGSEITQSLLERINNVASYAGIKEPIKIRQMVMKYED